MHRYHRRFGGVGTIVALADGRAFTAAHCLAAIDGRPGTPIDASGVRLVVVRRWSPSRTDLALLRIAGRGRGCFRLASRACVRVGVRVDVFGRADGSFERRRAVVTAVTATTATAEMRHPRGACGGDSGGAVVIGEYLLGIATHRTGVSLSSRCSSHVVFTRLDSPVMRARIAAAFAPVTRHGRRRA